MKVAISFTRKGDKLWVSTKRYTVWTRTTQYSFKGNVLLLDGRTIRLAYDGTLLKKINNQWVDVIC